MKKRTILMLGGTMMTAMIMLAACGSAPAEVKASGNPETPTTPVRTEPNPDLTSASKPVETNKMDPQGPAKASDLKGPADNPRRLYQLRELETVKIKVDDKHEFTAWIMDENGKRQEGMMYLNLEDYKENQCMVFVFPDAEERGFWMANCYADLDIAYLTPKKTIISVATMKAMDQNPVPSKGKAMYAIEFKPGLLKKKGIKPGMKVTFEREIKSKD